MDTDSFVLSFSEGNVDNEHMDLSNLDKPIKTNKTILSKFKHDLGSKVKEEFVVLKPKKCSIKNYGAKEKGIEKKSNGKHEEFYSALIDNKERIVEESRIQKLGSCMATIKISKRSFSNFDDKRFYLNNVKNYPLDENMYLFKRELLNKINNTTLELPIKIGLDVNKESLEALINKIKELTIKEDRKFIEAAIRLYNNLPT